MLRFANRVLASVENALPVRDQIPDVLGALAECQGLYEETYASLESIYLRYNTSN